MNTYYTNAGGTKTDQIYPSNMMIIDKINCDSEHNDVLEDASSYNHNTQSHSMKIVETYCDSNAPADISNYGLFGNVISINGTGASQLYLPWNYCINYNSENNSMLTNPPLYYRSLSDNYNIANRHWAPWRRIAYYDEIEAIVISILKSKGLIT